MNLFESIAIALQALWSHKLRSFLVLLGVIIAVASLIAVVSVIQGLNAKVTEIFTRRGADVFAVEQFPVTFSEEEWERVQKNPRLTREDFQFLRDNLRTARVVGASTMTIGTVKRGEKALEDVRIVGRTAEFAYLEAYDLTAGRYLTPQEEDHRRPVAVIGWGIADKLFPNLDPLDKTIKIRGHHFRVVGVASKQGSILGNPLDDFIAVPLPVFQKLFGRWRSLEISIKPQVPQLLQASMDETTLLMRVRHKLRPGERDDFGLHTSETYIGLYQSATRNIYGATTFLVAIALVVGGIVIMNIMIFSVVERTREIGIRKALGATRRNILTQFLIEALTLTSVGVLLGLSLGFSFAAGVSAMARVPYSVGLWVVPLALSIAFGTGLSFGIYPANKAARLDPIEALRYE